MYFAFTPCDRVEEGGRPCFFADVEVDSFIWKEHHSLCQIFGVASLVGEHFFTSVGAESILEELG